MKSRPSQSQQIPVQPSGPSCRCNTVATRNRCCLLDGHSALDLANRDKQHGVPCPQERQARWSKSRPFRVRPCTHSTARSAVGDPQSVKADAMKAPPRQPANRSHPIWDHRPLFAGYRGFRRHSPRLRAIELHLTIRRQTGERRLTSQRYAGRHCDATKHRRA